MIKSITENDTENTDTAVLLHVINNELGLNGIAIDEIQKSHRLGPKRLRMNRRLSGRVNSRPIVVNDMRCSV